MTDLRRLSVLCVSLCCLSGNQARAQDSTRRKLDRAEPKPDSTVVEILRGLVTTDSGVPIAGAEVIVTRAPDRLVERARSDATGHWFIRFANGTGDYLVYVAYPDRKSFRKRVTRGAPGFPDQSSADTVYFIPSALSGAITQLATIQVQAKKAHPERGFISPIDQPQPGASEKGVDDFNGLVPPELAGDVVALAATTPGLVQTTDGASALGLSPGQNGVVLGSLQLKTAQLPRDARTFVRVNTSTYDPARGWFGGAQIAVDLSPGSTYALRRAHLTVDAKPLQLTDRVGVAAGQRYSSLRGSYGGEGGFAGDRLSYNFGVDVAHRSQPIISLANASPEALLTAGLSSDSVARVLAILAQEGIPLGAVSGDGRIDTKRTDEISMIGRLGNPYFDYKKFEPSRRVIGLTAFSNWQRAQDLAIPISATPSRGADVSSGTVGLQGLLSSFITDKDWLLDARSGLTLSAERWTPNLALPGAQAFVGSSFDNSARQPVSGAVGVVPISFGGNGVLDTRRRDWLWENLVSLAFYSAGHNLHQLAATTDLRLDGITNSPASDHTGTFQYQSLDDIIANRPFSFSRTLSNPLARAAVWNGFVSLADNWRATPALQFLYGLRAEGNIYATRPADNPDLAQVLGVRTDHVPNTFALSPRFGFTWRRTASGDGYTQGRFGNLRVPYTSVVRGGFGQFRTLLGPDLVAGPTAATGLAGAYRQLLCTGDAVPATAWAAWATGAVPIPQMCSSASGAATLTDSAPGAVVIHPSYTAPRSWRGNLAVTGLFSKFAYSVEGIYSLNLNQPGTTDANFAGIERFRVADENRPVFVPLTSILTNTGTVSPTDARESPRFGSVLVRRSDLRSISRQLVVSLSPLGINVHQLWLSGSYVLGSIRQQAYGFDGATFGDPNEREWSPGDFDVRHQFFAQAGIGHGGFTATLFARVASGLPYTPIIGSDVNGDGFTNDRALVFDPSASSTDSLLAREMKSLLSSGSNSARSCLSANIGRVVARNACRTTWTAAVNARIGIDGSMFRLGRGTVIGLNLTNPLGGLDRLLHGNHLRGWGDQTPPDPVLFRVRSFDPATSKFFYDTNPRFGQAAPGSTLSRVPFRITIDISFDLAPPLEQQQVDKWLSPGRRGQPGPRLTADDIRKRYSRNTADPYGAILRQADSLLLQPAQVTALEAAQLRSKSHADSIWMPFADSLATLGNDYDVRSITEREMNVADSVWEYVRADLQETLPSILSPIQLRLLPAIAADIFTAPKNRKQGHFFF